MQGSSDHITSVASAGWPDAAAAVSPNMTVDQPDMAAHRKVAIVLFNLGGPDRPEAIKPFLLNLFRDPAILRVPFFVRPILARVIARARVAPATENYALLGGKSPLLSLTQEQGSALEAALPEFEAKCFIAMRYWHPFSLDTARQVKAWAPDEVVLLPLYPQYSTTTTGSSLAAWRDAAVRVGLAAQITTICCYPVDPAYAAATAALVKAGYDRARGSLDPAIPLRVLFSAHGLPEIIIKGGDPYQWQIEQTVAAVRIRLGRRNRLPDLLPVPRDAAEMDRSQHGRGSGARGEGQDGRSRRADRLRLRTYRDTGGTRRGVS